MAGLDVTELRVAAGAAGERGECVGATAVDGAIGKRGGAGAVAAEKGAAAADMADEGAAAAVVTGEVGPAGVLAGGDAA